MSTKRYVDMPPWHATGNHGPVATGRGGGRSRAHRASPGSCWGRSSSFGLHPSGPVSRSAWRRRRGRSGTRVSDAAMSGSSGRRRGKGRGRTPEACDIRGFGHQKWSDVWGRMACAGLRFPGCDRGPGHPVLVHVCAGRRGEQSRRWGVSGAGSQVDDDPHLRGEASRPVRLQAVAMRRGSLRCVITGG